MNNGFCKKPHAKIAECNSGASLISVIISMFFVTALGGTILYMTYTGYLIKATHEKSVTHSYKTAELMEFIRAGFQSAVSDSIFVAYNTSITNYSDNIALFESRLTEELLAWAVEDGEFAGENLAYKSGTGLNGESTYSYNLQVLASFLLQAGVEPGDIYIDEVSDLSKINAPIHLSANVQSAQGGIIEIITGEKIVFEGVTLTYYGGANANGGETSLAANNVLQEAISTDIVINIPNLFENEASGEVNIDFLSISDYAIIASEDLNINLNSAVVNGSAYANSIVLTAGGNTEISGTFITRNSLEIPTNHAVTLSENSALWAQNITLENGASLITASNSDVFVQNDLALNGTAGIADISGNYYGFGTSTVNPMLSSSIIVNGVGSTFNVSSAQNVMFFGNSFVVEQQSNSIYNEISNDTTQNSSVLMGESVSARPSQLAYLLPSTLLPVGISTNPHIMPASSPLPSTSEINTSAPIIGDKSLDYYGATVKTLAYNLAETNSKAVYFFINFSTPEAASTYFKDYFSQNETNGELTQYIDAYANFSEHALQMQTRGYAIEQTASGQYILPEILPVNEDNALYMQTVYSRLCTSLSNSETTANTPYDYIINTAEIEKFVNSNENTSEHFAALSGISTQNAVFEFKNSENNTVALVINNENSTPFVLNTGEFENVSLIISSGDVTLNRAFSGLIISNGNVTLATNGAISANAQNVHSAINAVHTVDGTAIKNLLTGTADMALSGEINAANALNIADLAVYENWFAR